MAAESGSSRYSAEFDLPLRGDAITAERYISTAFMERESEHLWPRVWLLGAMVAEFEQEGDYVRHNLGKESVIMVRQADDSIKAFYNTCPHRGNRLILGDIGGSQRITCGYHGWEYS